MNRKLERWFVGGGLAVSVLIAVLAVVIDVRASSISNGGGGGGGAAGANVTTAFSATPTFTCPSATQGTIVNFALSSQLTANITSSTLSGCTNGSLLNFLFTQDATGGRTVSMPAGFDQATINPAAGVSTKCAYYLDAGGLGHLTGGGCVSTAGFGFGPEVATPANPPAGSCFSWFDSTNAVPEWNCSSVVFNAVFPQSRVPNQFVTGILATGQITNSLIAAADVPAALSSTTSVNGTTIPAAATLTRTIASGTTAMPTGALAGNSCDASATTSAGSGIQTSDAVAVTFASDPTGVVGYGGGTPNGGITINAWPTSGQMNFKTCNQTASSITRGAISVNWRDTR